MNEFSYMFRDFADQQYKYSYREDRPNGYGIGGDEQHSLAVHDESSILDQSNHAVILADLKTIDERVNTVWINGEDFILIPLVPAVVDATAKWLDALAHYPAADDTDLSERETADLLESLKRDYDIGEDTAPMVARQLFETDSICYSEELTDKAVDAARNHVHAALLDDLGFDEDARHDIAREMLADEDDHESTLVIARDPHDECARTALVPIATKLRDLGIDPDVATADDGTRVVLILDWNDARTLVGDQ
jgi:hypothetical protein